MIDLVKPNGPLPVLHPPAGVSAALARCIHCGLCLEACPTYRETRLEPDSPRGRIFLMREIAGGRADPAGAAGFHLDRCLGCRACESACPSGVPYGEALEWGREVVNRARPRGALEALARFIGLFVLLPSPRLLDLTFAFARLFARFIPLMPADRDRSPLPALTKARRRSGGHAARVRVALLAGCVTERALPGLNRATARVLAHHGCDVIVPPGAHCCGALATHAGENALGKRLMSALATVVPSDVDYVVSNAAGCGSSLREHFSNFRDVCELLDDLGIVPPTASDSDGDDDGDVIGYDDPCHLLHAQGISRAPRAMLESIPGARLVEIDEADACCGSAGIYNLVERDLAERILARKMDRIRASGATIVATANPGCMLQIAAGARARRMSIEVLHPIEILDRAYRAGGNYE